MLLKKIDLLIFCKQKKFRQIFLLYKMLCIETFLKLTLKVSYSFRKNLYESSTLLLTCCSHLFFFLENINVYRK